jgi:hypothetical protein
MTRCPRFGSPAPPGPCPSLGGKIDEMRMHHDRAAYTSGPEPIPPGRSEFLRSPQSDQPLPQYLATTGVLPSRSDN